MTLRIGQRVRTVHPTMMGAGKVEGVYDGDGPDHVVGPMLNGYTERNKQGWVRYSDHPRKLWMLDAIEPVDEPE